MKAGDYALAINGTKLSLKDNYWKLLTGPLNEWVSVTVAAAPDAPAAQQRDLRIRTIASMGNLKYEDWVARNPRFVDSVSGGNRVLPHALDNQECARPAQTVRSTRYLKSTAYC